jgi:hypothetical protein
MKYQYSHVGVTPKENGPYIVKTKKGRDEIADYSRNGWLIRGDNRMDQVMYWIDIPQMPDNDFKDILSLLKSANALLPKKPTDPEQKEWKKKYKEIINKLK